ncbi:MAG: biopolymer transporter ExbD [Chitinophagales bacterium]|nr:biopolymer transporter ExbD [Chitinophagales bacterium]
MPKVKVPRKSTTIDMTPMVDMAFLLVTFFMLTTQMRPEEPVTIKKPSSISTIIIPSKDIMTITVSSEGKAFFDLSGKYFRQTLIQKMAEEYNTSFTQDEINTFAVLTTVGVPMAQMKQFLDLRPEDRKKIKQSGIPIDSMGGELRYWIGNARAVDANAIITIQGDQDANVKAVKQVIATLQNQDVNRFSLITDKETPPTGYIADTKKTK